MNKEINKACEITDAKISFVSLVDKAANKRTFLITKAEDGTANWKSESRIIKAADHHVTGVVYEPLKEDSQGEFMTADEIQKACYWFAKNGDAVDIQHNFEAHDGISVVENWVAKADFDVDGETIVKGTWLITAEVSDSDIWDKITKGEITGFSMGGKGKLSTKDVDLGSLKKEDKEDKPGLLAKIAKALGLKAVVKGDVAEIFEARAKSSLFWNAVNVLEDCLFHYNWETRRDDFESDEEKLRECLSDFNEIITNLLTNEKLLTKAIAPDFETLSKAGKKMSGKNKETLSGIYSSLGEFLKEFDEPEEKEPDEGKEGNDKNNNEQEETEVNKEEMITFIKEEIAKALGKTPEAQPQPQTEPEKVEKSEITAEFITQTVNDAIKKALNPEVKQEEPLTVESVTKMIHETVAKALEPIRKQVGIPANLNDTQVVKEDGEHYLHGIL